ncbi:MAG: rhomboid family intramembrane serine protease [Acidobacteriota bacterium]|nr:rhomboid family intramembrane serine protease [Acidobacteriota bacterium]
MFERKPKTSQPGRPSVCRSCGAIVGAGQDACAVCGAPLKAQAARNSGTPSAAYDNETIRFARAVLSRPYIFTIIFLIANFFLFLMMWRSSGMTGNTLWLFPGPVLVHYGAKLNSLIDQQHQWWRFVTPMFLHASLLHLLVNMYSLWMIGPYVEKLYGSAKFVFFWVVTGVAGVVASYLTVVGPGTHWGGGFIFKTQDAPSVGASGALFGLIGVLFVFGIKFRNELPEGFKRAFGTGLLPVILINLFIGFMGRGFIDNAAHLGGLVCGAALALVISYRRPGERSRMALVWQVLQVASLALVALSFARAAPHAGDPTPLDQTIEEQPIAPSGKALEFLTFAKAMNESQDVFLAAVKGDSNGVEAAVASLGKADAPDIKADQLKRKLLALLLRTKQPQGDQAQKSQLLGDFAAWEKEYAVWLKTSGKVYEG